VVLKGAVISQDRSFDLRRRGRRKGRKPVLGERGGRGGWGVGKNRERPSWKAIDGGTRKRTGEQEQQEGERLLRNKGPIRGREGGIRVFSGQECSKNQDSDEGGNRKS